MTMSEEIKEGTLIGLVGTLFLDFANAQTFIMNGRIIKYQSYTCIIATPRAKSGVHTKVSITIFGIIIKIEMKMEDTWMPIFITYIIFKRVKIETIFIFILVILIYNRQFMFFARI
jgi:hypothetical protein